MRAIAETFHFPSFTALNAAQLSVATDAVFGLLSPRRELALDRTPRQKASLALTKHRFAGLTGVSDHRPASASSGATPPVPFCHPGRGFLRLTCLSAIET
jgi:hypothetical protein